MKVPQTQTRRPAQAQESDHAVTLLAAADSWTDEGSPGANHGASSLLQVSHSVLLAQDEGHAYLLFDLSGFGGFSGIAELPLVALTMHIETPVLSVAFSMSIDAAISASPPWAEGEINWSNAPAHPLANVGQLVFPVTLLGFSGDVTAVLDLTQVPTSAVLGNYLSLRTRMSGLVQLGVFRIRSREHAGPAPRIAFAARGVL